MHFRPRFVWCRLYSFAYGNAAARTFGRARRHRPYDFVWVGNDVGERKYNPQGGSLFACVITQGSLLSSATLGYQKYNPNGVAVSSSIYYNSTTWGVTTSPRGIARRSRLALVLLGGKLDVAGVVFQNLLAQGCRVDMRINLCG